ncbi:piggyBac transposable element-derived protein 4-like [Hydra vulgaris]|uniref:PiggyBac transposable element-derived protein 4-like n=1 Tax=Hydra vulgaris TaxID=6087 RepID=A0ABM4D0E2_HYDVU
MADKQVFSVQKPLTKKQIFTHEKIEKYIFDKNEELSEVSEEEYSLSDVSDEKNFEPEILELGLEKEMPALVDALSSSDNSLENVFPGSYIPIWKSAPSNNRVHPFEFTGISGCNQDIVKNDPLYFFELYLTDEICEFIINEINRYASQTINKNELSVKSRMRRWLLVTVSKVRQYIAIFYIKEFFGSPRMKSIVCKRRIQNPLFASAGIKWLLSYNKFKLIDKFIHFVDFTTLPNKYPVLSKLSTVWDYLTKKFQEVYTPTQNISIDKSLLLWKGSERNNTLSSDYRYVATKIVMFLMDGLLDQGYKLYIDNLYFPYELSSVLLLRSTDTIETLQKNRKGLPISIHEKLKKMNAKFFTKKKQIS